MDRHDVYTADECFLTGTAAELIPVVECDGRVLGSGRPGPITRDLRQRFQAWSARSARHTAPGALCVIEIKRSSPRPISAPTRKRPSALRAGWRNGSAPSCICVNVLSEIIPAGPDPLLMPVMPPQFYQENEARAKETLRSLIQPSWGKPTRLVTAVRWGSPVEAIVDYAQEQQIDMIVIATHGRTGLSHVLLGSVAERIVREAHCPVLTIRDPKHAAPAIKAGA